MEHRFFTAAASDPAETLRWLSVAEKLLSTRDLLGAKSCATRARDADSTRSAANAILAVVDTLLAGERRIGNNQPDFYSILRLTPQQGGDPDLVAGRYRGLVVALNPQNNRFPFADQAFRLVVDAWTVLSSPPRKSIYDKELGFFFHRPDPFRLPAPAPAPQQNFVFDQPQQQQVNAFASAGRTQFAQAPQVNPQPRAGPVFARPTPEPRKFTGFHSGSNIAFVPIPGPEPVSNPGQDNNFSTYVGYNVTSSASVTTHEQLNNDTNDEEQPEQDYLNAGGSNSFRNVSDNAQETVAVEDEENVDRIVEEEEEEEEEEEVVVEERDDLPVNDHGKTFWTACPYCYYMYEYPEVYVDCAMRCRNCKMAFQAVVIPSPPPVVDGQDAYFCCWGFMPFGVSMDIWEKIQGSALKTGYVSRKPPAPRVYVDEDADIFADISSSSDSDVDWQDDRDRKRKNTVQNVRGRQASGMMQTSPLKKVLASKCKNNAEARDAVVSSNATEVEAGIVEGRRSGGRKQPNMVAKSFDKLDLNVELSNEAEDVSVNFNKGKELGRREDDNMEGIGFFDGLDELFSNLPILKAA